jgi:hypothetical protein
MFYVRNHGPTTAVLERVRPLAGSRGLTVARALVANARHGGTGVGLIRGFPPPQAKGITAPVRGFRIPTGGRNSEFQLVVEVHAGAHGGVLRGIAIDYHIGDREYSAEYPERLRLCVPRSVPIARCQPPTG